MISHTLSGDTVQSSRHPLGLMMLEKFLKALAVECHSVHLKLSTDSIHYSSIIPTLCLFLLLQHQAPATT